MERHASLKGGERQGARLPQGAPVQRERWLDGPSTLEQRGGRQWTALTRCSSGMPAAVVRVESPALPVPGVCDLRCRQGGDEAGAVRVQQLRRLRGIARCGQEVAGVRSGAYQGCRDRKGALLGARALKTSRRHRTRTSRRATAPGGLNVAPPAPAVTRAASGGGCSGGGATWGGWRRR